MLFKVFKDKFMMPICKWLSRLCTKKTKIDLSELNLVLITILIIYIIILKIYILPMLFKFYIIIFN